MTCSNAVMGRGLENGLTIHFMFSSRLRQKDADREVSTDWPTRQLKPIVLQTRHKMKWPELLYTQLVADWKECYYIGTPFLFGDYMDIELKLVCRNCGHKNQKSGSQVDDRICINCRNCGHRIVVDTGKLQTHLLNLEHAVKEAHFFECSVTIK